MLDVGAGSGVLAIFAAKAGAKRVYAVEATDMAKFARKVVQHNKVSPTMHRMTQLGMLCQSAVSIDALKCRCCIQISRDQY